MEIRILKETAFPSLNLPDIQDHLMQSSEVNVQENTVNQNIILPDSELNKDLVTNSSFNSSCLQNSKEDLVLNISKTNKDTSTTTDDFISSRTVFAQTEFNVNVKCARTQTGPYTFYSYCYLKRKKNAIHYYTGLNTELFDMVLRTLGPAAYELKYKWSQVNNITVENQFLMTLMKLRRAIPDFELALMFDTSKKTVQNIVVTWINFMYREWKKIDLWPSKDFVGYYMPEAFKEMYPSTRVILDGTEVPIEAPSTPHFRQATFSTYKNKTTIKSVIGMTPGGLISYVSPAYGGSASDRAIIERSDLMKKCDPSDSIMADRGFNIQDIFAPHFIAVNIPAFKKGQPQLPGMVIQKDRELANKRVHIERIIGLAKTYKILKNTIPVYYVPLASEIVFICCMLCNFRPNIMKNV